MGRKSRHFDEDERFARCGVCHEDIIIEFYQDSGDVVYCDECDSKYLLQSRDPIRLSLIDEDFDDYDEEGFDDDYLGRGFD